MKAITIPLIIILLPALTIAQETEQCDWKVSIELKEPLPQNAPEWSIVTSKITGNKTRIILERKVTDIEGNILKDYSNLSFYSTYRKTVKNRPSLEPKRLYLIEAKIHTLDCNDTNKENSIDSKLFFITGNKTKYAQQTGSPSYESIINKSEINLVYESNDAKARKYAIPALCAIQAIIIIALVAKK